MCGIFGYIGKERDDLSSFLLIGLSKLEYRGYDSSGLAIVDNGKIKMAREVGEIKNLQKLLKGKKISGSIGIGHTRWATHGGVTKKNTHPHRDCTGGIAVVHNGIIENFQKLKKDLIKKGHKFASETDTEVFAHLVEENTKKGKRFVEAIRISFNKLRGFNAVVVLSKEGKMVAFRKGSPIIAGIDKEAKYISSDIPTLSSLTSKILLINENEGVVLSDKEIFVINAKTGKKRRPRYKNISMEEVVEDKGDYDHFLIKEIYEQPEVLMRVAANKEKEIRYAARLIKDAWGTYFTACGTAAHAGLAATYMFSEIAKRHVNFAVGSEFPFIQDFLEKRSLLIAASQSGETMDTLEAVRAAKKHRSKVLALVNVPGSTLTRIADYTILLKAGPEKAVLATKSYIAKLGLFLLFAYTIARKYKEGVDLLQKASNKMTKLLNKDFEKRIIKLARRLKNQDSIYIIGRGVNYPTALEGALKIKEASYIHAEGFAAGELKHGVIALIEKGTPCIAVVANDRAKESVISNAAELKSRGGYIIGIAPKDNPVFDHWIKVPDVGPASPIINVVPMQLLAYHLTVLKGYNPDKPRNLAKSVTVK